MRMGLKRLTRMTVAKKRRRRSRERQDAREKTRTKADDSLWRAMRGGMDICLRYRNESETNQREYIIR